MLDEIFDSSLDGQGTDDFLKILNTLENENIFIISHKTDMIADRFKNVIRYEKVGNFTKVVEWQYKKQDMLKWQFKKR